MSLPLNKGTIKNSNPMSQHLGAVCTTAGKRGPSHSNWGHCGGAPLHQTAVFGFRHPACSIQKILQRR